MINIFTQTGRTAVQIAENIGAVVCFMFSCLGKAFTRPFYGRLLRQQIVEIGYFSVPVVGMTTLFAGMVLALQSFSGVNATLAENTIPALVVLAITRELAPVLAGLMVAGRIGAAIAAEIGTMRVSEQIDALYTLDVDPKKYLIVPRLLAGLITLPLLVLMGDAIGILGGYIVGVYQLGFNSSLYIYNSWQALEAVGVVSGIVKAASFGFIITFMGCYHGYHSKGGAEGVGNATTRAVVSASILILIANYMVTVLFFEQ